MKRRRISLYESPYASEVRKRYIERLGEEKTKGDPLCWMQETFTPEEEKPEKEREFWLALADTMWQFGRLTEAVKARALLAVDGSRQALLPLQSVYPQRYADRMRLLDAMEKTLYTPPPKPKRVQKRRVFENDWEAGEVRAFRLSENAGEFEGGVVCIHVVRRQTYGGGHVVPVVRVFCRVFDDIPAVERLPEISYLPQFWGPAAYTGLTPSPARRSGVLYNMLLSASSIREYRRFEPVGRLPLEKLEGECAEEVNESACRLFEAETVSSLRKWKDADVYALLKGR